MKVFISHTNQPADMQIINRILQQSATVGIQCYMAEYDVKAGGEVKAKLKQEMQSSICVLVFITKGTAESDWVRWEVGAADAMGKLVIPIVDESIKLPGFLAGKEYIALDTTDPGKTSDAVFRFLEKKKLEIDNSRAIALLVLLLLGLLIFKQ